MLRHRKLIIILLIAVGIGIYVFFQGYDLLRGPVVSVESPVHGQSFNEPLIEITGSAKNISFIYLNDTQIFVNPEGDFSEQLLLLPGYNIITIRATDKFNREVQRELHLILNEHHGSQEEES